VTITEERKLEMDFSTPYINAGQVLIVRANTAGVTTLADLKQGGRGPDRDDRRIRDREGERRYASELR
jgi:ABC-type amino acid transport substrate-binding protein